MAAWRSATERKTPRFKRCLDSLAKKPSTALSQEHEVGVKLEDEALVPVEPGADRPEWGLSRRKRLRNQRPRCRSCARA